MQMAEDEVFVSEPAKPAEDIQEAKSQEPEQEMIRKIAVPRWSAEQLAVKAKESGDEPVVFEDEIAKVTFFDYSEIISGNQKEEQE